MSEKDDIASEVEDSEIEVVNGDAEGQESDAAIEDDVAKQPFRVVYQTNNFLLPQIRDLITEGDDVNLRPEYQRRLRWSNQQKSLLIESLLLNVPVPPVFFYENDLARYEVMDGQQRLNAIKEFMKNEFSLRGLQVLSSLNGKNLSRLPPRVKRSLDRASISAIVLLQESQGQLKRAGSSKYYELRRFVFERLNTGGKRLSAQEIRNAVYGGHFNNMIVSLSRNETFTRVWGIPPYIGGDPNDYYEDEARQKNSLYKTMGDCQLVLRFFALKKNSDIQGSMKSMMDRCMERNIDITEDDVGKLSRLYLKRLRLADELFDGRPFNINPEKKGIYRPVAGIYDGVMVALDSLRSNGIKLLDRKKEVQKSYAELVSKERETGILTGSANTAADIKQRIKLFKELFTEFV